MGRKAFFLLNSLLVALALQGCAGSDFSFIRGSERIELSLNPSTGTIASLSMGGTSIPFRHDHHCGPAWEGMDMHPGDSPLSFSGERDSILYNISYRKLKDNLAVDCSVENIGTEAFSPERLRLVLGVDTEMHGYPQWDTIFFPTLLRCEKDFAWGYFSTPTGKVLAFATEEPVASYAMNYRYEGSLEWVWGHQIFSASLDMLHKGPLPERHPQDLDSLKPGQKLSWTLHLGLVDGLEAVKPAVARWSGAAMIECDAYTVESGRDITAQIISPKKAGSIKLTTPSGEIRRMHPRKGGIVLDRLDEKGLYKLEVTVGGKTSEAMCYVREDWGWYLQKVRDFQLTAKPRIGNSAESFYGYFPAFEAAELFPEPAKDSVFTDLLRRSVPNMIDTLTWDVPDWIDTKERIQNYSSLAGIYAKKWKSSGDIHDLEKAGALADYVIARQAEDGSYRCNGTHYTAVIYPAKSIFDVALAEKEAGLDEAAARHRESAMRACIDLCDRLDDIDTEGDLTFEDGMISCSALQMAYAALNTDDPGLRSRLTEGARYMMRKHQCLEQRLIPDCRMRGATLRYWEALDTYFVPNQVMNSPHGWTAWKAYAVYYLYLLTGEKEYLDDLNDTLGACVQLVDLNGKLRWCFLPDPYIDALVAVPDPDGRSRTTERRIVGEQYMEMISDWCRPVNDTGYVVFGEDGGEGDGTVYEIFNAVYECKCIQ